MNVDDCIKAYWRLGTLVFWPRRYGRAYSSKVLRKAIVRIIQEHCGCHADGRCPSPDTERLRQYDYAERDDVCYKESPSCENFTCKV